MSTKPNCSLSVFPARDVPRAVIIRRGPSKLFHVMLWNMQTDAIQHGSWFRGMIYADSCDISPDGQFFRYCAHNGSRRTWENLGSNAWTAICRPPFLKALSMHVSHDGTWELIPNHFVTKTDSQFNSAAPDPCLPSDLRLMLGRRKRLQTPEVEGADWVGLDHKDRVIFTLGSELWRCLNSRRKVAHPKLVADFKDLVPPWQRDDAAK